MTLTRLQLRYFTLFVAFIAFTPSLAQAGTWVAFGPKTYTRGTGSPVTVTDTFTLLNPATQYTLKAFNGGLQNDTTDLVAYSVVFLNGVQVVGPTNFNQSVSEVDVPIFPQAANTLSVQVRGKPGGVLAIEIIGVDNDPPTITASLSPAPNAAGWNNSPVTVSFTCSDKTSGVASCPSPVTVSTEGANQVVSGTATDLAGNTASTSVTINLDMTPPTITGTINPPPDAGGYNSSAVTVTFTCSDALSGVATCSPPVYVSSENTTPETGTATDVAGNTASVTITVNISFNYFKIQSWQTGPLGNAKSPSGKCLDYGTSPSGNAATVFLNDCSSAHAIRVVELPDYTDAHMNTFRHEVLLYAGNSVIGIDVPIISAQPGTPGTPQLATEYQLSLQAPFTSRTCITGGFFCDPAKQIFRLDGDSIILEGMPGQRSPCLNIDTPPLCPPLAPQLVIQIQKARGANGSPLVAGVRNLADNEFWDFSAIGGSGRPPTKGFSSAPITTNYALWNATCSSPSASPTSIPTAPCSMFKVGWGSVIVITDSDPNECGNLPNVGPCIDLSLYPPFVLPAGVTLRGNRRGSRFGPQLYYSYSSWLSAHYGQDRQFTNLCGMCMLQAHGDYVRVTGLRMRGESRSTDQSEPSTDGIQVDYPGDIEFAPPPLAGLATFTEFIATIDHNDMSDWGDGAVRGSSPFKNSLTMSNECSYTGFLDSAGSQWYGCDQYNRLVPSPGSYPYPSMTTAGVPIADDPATLANVRVARNFLHHNQRDEQGYGANMARALIEGNTFLFNRHDITTGGEPHNEYRASNNLVLSGAPIYKVPLGRLQDFDVHGTDNVTNTFGKLFFGGAGGYYVEIDRNTFLAGDGHDYVLRGYPVVNTYYHNNVSRRNENVAINFIHCAVGCVSDYLTTSDFPINISNSQFGQSTPDPASTLGVGDFDGDGDDDLFMATGASWYYSPAGQREWRFLNSEPDTIDQLLLGDFDGDGRTDVVALRNGQLVVSWGGISAFEVLNSNPLPPGCTSITNMAVGDFDGDGLPDIFCADGLNSWWISYGGNTPFVQVNTSSFPRSALLFGDFNGDGKTDVFGIVLNGSANTWSYTPSALGTWVRLRDSLSGGTVNGLVVGDFNGDGVADIGMACSSGGVLGIGASPGWQISYGGAQGWSTCNTFAGSGNSVNCFLSLSPCITLANGAVGRFSGGPGADILLWSYYNSQGAATLWDFPGGTGTPYQFSSQDMH